MSNVPKLRFKEFNNEYLEYKLSQLMKRYSAKNTDNEFGIDDILSLSSIHGIVDRRELLDDTYSKVNHTNYLKTKLNDFVYGKSISASYPYGLFKVNNCRDGLLSTLYFTFRTLEKVSPHYLDKYFSHLNRANNFLKKYVLVGDRYITADSDYILSGKIFIPSINEQEKIVLFLNSIDTKLKQLTKKESLLQDYKKSVMQKIFNQEIRFKADDGSEFCDWEDKKFVDILKEYSDKDNSALNEVVSIGKYGIRKRDEIYSKELSKDISNNKIIYQNTLSIGMGSTQIDIGILLENKIYSVSPAYSTFKILNIDAFYLKQLFLLLNKKLSSLYMITGARQGKSVNKKELLNHIIILPSFPEQTKIANFLSSIDSKIEQVKKQLNSTKEFKKALLQQMFV